MYGAGWDHRSVERPRKINNTGVGKIAFITSLEPGRQEKDRRIVGYFIIKNTTGGEKTETLLLGDAADGFVVPPSINLMLWDYYRNPRAPGKTFWGTGLFRYLDDRTASDILIILKTRCLSQGIGDIEASKIERALASVSNTRKHVINHLPPNDMNICPSCKKIIRENVNFCTQCRAKVISCQSCKHYNLEGDHYCSNCGDPINREVGAVALNKSTVSPRTIKDRLLEYGKANKKTLEEMSFCRDPEADTFVKTNAFAFLLGVIFDQGVRAEVAWSAPYELRKRLGNFDVCKMAELTDAEIESIICGEKKLHRFWKTTGKRIVDAAKKVVQEYGCDAAKMWSDMPRAEDLERRFREFDGIGQKKASMAVNILARDFGVPIQNWSGIDVSNDVMIKRVFLRAGLATKDTEEAIVEAGRKLNPDYPGALDFPAWDIGRKYCLNSNPLCSSCPLQDICPKMI
jgi:uncharacterized HhH-GPD family protein